MKKKALWKDIFKEMWKSKARFLSIFAIITLGVAFFAGIKATGPDMIDTADHYYQDKNLMDLKVVSTYGLEQEDLELLETVKGATVRGTYSQDVILQDSRLVTKIMGYPKDAGQASNQYAVESGRMPEKSGEIALDANLTYTDEYQLGDTVTLTTDDQETPLSDTLVVETYQVVGFVHNPQYIENYARGSSTVGKGTLDGFAVVLDTDFDSDYFTEAYLTFSDTASLEAYSKEYEDKVEVHTKEIEELVKEQPQERLDTIQSEAQKEIDEGQAEIDEAKEKLADGQKQLDDAKQTIAAGWEDYQAGQEKLTTETTKAQAEIDANSQKLADGKAELATKRAELEAGQTELNQAKETFENKKAAAQAQLSAGANELDANQQKIDEGLQAIQAAEAELEDGKAAIASGRAELDTKAQEIQTGEAALANQKAELQAGQKELDAAKQTFETQKNQVQDFSATVRQLINTPIDSVPAETQATLIAAAGDVDSSMGELLRGYFSGQLPASDVTAALDSVQNSLTAGEAELAAKQQETDQGQQAIQSAETELAEGKAAVKAGQAELTTNQQKIQSGEPELAAKRAELEAAQTQLNEAKETFEAQKADGEAQLAGGEAEIAANQQQIDAGFQAIQAAETELADGEAQLTEGQAKLAQEKANGEAELAAAKQQLEAGQADYDTALAEFETKKKEADKEISEGEAELADAKKELAALTVPEYFVFDRSVNPGYAEFSDNAERISAIAQVFPVFFFLIAALVCLTTMTRMVDEQRLQIGTLKALGYSNWDISKKFLVYASLASIVGTVIGLVIGYEVFPAVIFNAYGSLYNLPSVRITYYLSYALISFAIAILCTVASAYVATRVELDSNAAELMRPKAPKIGKRIMLERIPFIWNRMGFIQKVTARNLFRYKQRMLMTVLGVAGCTALILTGFGLSDSIADMADLQYGKVMKYDALVAYNTDTTEEEDKEYQDFIGSQTDITGRLDVLQEIYSVSEKGVNTQDVTIFVPEETTQLADYVLLNDRSSGENYSLSDDGAIITEKLAKLFDVKIGDSLTLTDTDNDQVNVTVNQIVENYTGHYVFMTKDYYEAAVDQQPDYNTQLLNYDKTKSWEDKLGSELTNQPKVAAVNFVRQISGAFGDTMASLAIVTLVLIVSAGLLAFVVLYNLTNINVSERIRELSTIKVLGFYDKEVTMYIYRENIILTLMGVVAGSFLGMLLHRFVLSTAEVDIMMFSPDIQPLSFLYSGLLTILFSGIVMIAMHIKLKDIDMIEALKSVD